MRAELIEGSTPKDLQEKINKFFTENDCLVMNITIYPPKTELKYVRDEQGYMEQKEVMVYSALLVIRHMPVPITSDMICDASISNVKRAE